MHQTYCVSARRWLFQGMLLALATLAFFIWPPPASAAAAIVVDSLSETSSAGHCTLRNAISAANGASIVFGCNGTASVAHTITFSIAGTIHVTDTLPIITQPLTIDGGNNIIIDGSGTHSLMQNNAAGVVNLYNLTFQNAFRNNYFGAVLDNESVNTLNISNTKFLSNTAVSYSGGALNNYGTMNIYGSTFSNNQSTQVAGFGGNGGAIINSTFAGGCGCLAITNTTFYSNATHAEQSQGGAVWSNSHLTVTNSSFTSNKTDTSGGAIQGGYLSSLRVVSSTFTINSAISTTYSVGGALGIYFTDSTVLGSSFTNNSTGNNYGGAIAIQDSNVVIGNTTISNNTAGSGGGYGGGIDVYGSTIAITNSAIIGNHAYGAGGIHVGSVTTMTLTNDTISGNIAQTNGGGIMIDNLPVTLTLNNVTIANNIAGNGGSFGEGGGINVIGTVRLKNTIVAQNHDNAGTANNDCFGTLVSQNNNLLGDNTGCSGLLNGVNFDKVGTGGSPLDPKLGSLIYLGGLTPVLPLLSNSPALNAGSNATCATTDQRGVARPNTVGNPCDMGAFEGLLNSLYLPLLIR